MSIKVDNALKHLENLGFNIDLDYQIWKESLDYFCNKDDLDGLVKYMSKIQNCGGYALNIPICIWPVNNYTFEEKVLRIMELYPFVRLLSNGKLKENEYIVKYRAEGNDGHHFIKIDDNGQIVEKDASGLPRNFENWGNLESASEAVFAVLKSEYRDIKLKELPQCNRNMYLDSNAYEYKEDSYTSIELEKAPAPMTFEKTLKESYKSKKNSFKYNNKEFHLKIENKDKDLIYICDNKNILGILYTDGETFIIELYEEKKHDIYGFLPKKTIQQKNEQIIKRNIENQSVK